MLLVIHNLPLNTRFGDVKSLLLEKCGLRNLILDKLIFEDNAMKITVGLPTEEDAAFLVRKINGLYVKGHQLYVQDLRQKPSEQPYRLPKPVQQDDYQQQNWSNNPKPSWINNQEQGWNNNSQQSRFNDSQQSWTNDSQQSWTNNAQQSWTNDSQQSRTNNSQQSWINNSQPSRTNNQQQNWNNNQEQSWNNPVQTRTIESQRNSNPFLYQQQNQNVEGGFGKDLAAAAAVWAQQAQRGMYDSQSVHYPQNVQNPQQFGQFDTQGGWDQSDQVNQGFERDGGEYTNANTSWGENSVTELPAASRGRSRDMRQSKESHRGRPERSFEREARDRSRQHSQPRAERSERLQAGTKRRWDESARGADDWRQRPASPPREFRQHHRARDRRSGFDSAVEPWTDAPNRTFLPSNSRFDAPKPRFEGPNPNFEPKPKFNKRQKFNAPNQKFNTPNQKFNTPPNQKFNAPNQKFNAPNQKFNASKPKYIPQNRFNTNKTRLENIPWEKLTEKQQQKIIKRNEFNRNRTVSRITFDIFNDLGLNQEDKDLKTYFIDPVRSRLNRVLGDEKFDRLDMMYAKYLDAYNDDKQQIFKEAQQLQKDGVKPQLQKLFAKPVSINLPASSGETSNAPQAKRFKADGVQTGPHPGPPKPVSGKIPSYVDGNKQKFKEIKQQHLKDMETMRCPDVGTELDPLVDEEVHSIANIFVKVAENAPDEKQKTFLQERVNEECIDDFKKMFKQKICQRLVNEGAKIVRIYAFTGKPPKKAELEPFMRQFGTLALKKSDRKPFFTAHLDSYKTLDKLCNMGNVKVGNSEVVFKPLHMTPKYKKIHISSLNKMRNKYIAKQIKKPEVDILEKDWEVKLAAIKENEEILKQEQALVDAENEILRREKAAEEKAARDAAKKETDVDAENCDVKPENGHFKRENAKVKPENGNVEPENVNVEPENGNVKPESRNVKLENGNVKQENVNVELETGNVEPENGNVEPENGNAEEENPENPNMDVHTDKYGELHANFDVIDEVQGSDTENDQKNNEFNLNEEDKIPEQSEESILRELPVGSDPEIIFDDDDDEGEGDDEEEGGDDDNDQTIAEDIDLDNIDENDLEDY